jgi:hypothetical protein
MIIKNLELTNACTKNRAIMHIFLCTLKPNPPLLFLECYKPLLITHHKIKIFGIL